MKNKIYSIMVYDRLILVDCKTGEGLNYLFDKVKPKLQGLAKSYYMDGQNQDDKVQDLQIKLWQIIPQYRPSKSSFHTFMCNCLGNYIKNQIRHNVRFQSKYIQNYESLTQDMIKKYDEKTGRRR